MERENDFRTDFQKSNAVRNAAICERYTSIRRDQPLVSRNRVLCVVAKEYGLTGMSIKKILRKYDLYN